MTPQSHKAQVRNGRLVLDDPSDLPEGTEVVLVSLDSWDDLTDEERERLHKALAQSEEDLRQGRVRSAEKILDELRDSKR